MRIQTLIRHLLDAPRITLLAVERVRSGQPAERVPDDELGKSIQQLIDYSTDCQRLAEQIKKLAPVPVEAGMAVEEFPL